MIVWLLSTHFIARCLLSGILRNYCEIPGNNLLLLVAFVVHLFWLYNESIWKFIAGIYYYALCFQVAKLSKKWCRSFSFNIMRINYEHCCCPQCYMHKICALLRPLFKVKSFVSYCVIIGLIWKLPWGTLRKPLRYYGY